MRGLLLGGPLFCFGGAGHVVEPQHGGDGLGIADGSADDHANRRRKWDHALVDDLVFLGLGLAFAQAGGQEDRHGLGDESRAGIELQNAAPLGGCVSGFFEQFAFGGLEFLLAGIDAAGRYFPEIVVGGVAVLSFEKDAGRGVGIVHGQHDDGAGVMDDVAASLDAAGLLNVVGGYGEDRAVINGAGGEETDFVG